MTLALFAPYHACYGKEKVTIGWVEKIRIYPAELVFNAKVDTGARNSSIHAKNIEDFERDGQAWVRFDVVNQKEESVTLELPLLRQATIKRHFGKRQYRHVVMLGICLGNIYKETEVTLVDREGFLYDMLLGRSYLKGNFIIDLSETFTSSPTCVTPNHE